MKATPLSFEQIKGLPKLELHIHLEGCIAYDFIKNKAEEKKVHPPRPLERLFDTSDLSEFLETLDWVCSLIESDEDAEQLAWSFGQYCKQQNIVYCELIVNPTHWKNIAFAKLFTALNEGFKRVDSELGVDVRLLPSLLRQQSKQSATELANWIASVHTSLDRIVGISVDGNESVGDTNPDKFREAYQIVRACGLGCTAHAGESSGPEGVQSALDILGVHRIDHGVRVIEDAQLLQRVIDNQVALNVCVSSNCRHMYSDIDAHPFLALFKKGVPVTLNTDDPIALNITLNEELLLVANGLGLDLNDLVTLQLNAVAASFSSPATKRKLKEAILGEP